METPEYKAREAAKKAEEQRQAALRAKEEKQRQEEEARQKAEQEKNAALSAAEEAERKAEEERQAAERARLAAIAAEEAAEAEHQSQIRTRKASMKKLKEIALQEKKIADRGQTLADQPPEVQEKVGKKATLEAQVAELNSKLGPLED